jgi:hypothetical protein
MERYIAMHEIEQNSGLPEEEMVCLFVERGDDEDLEGGDEEEELEEGSVIGADNVWKDWLDIGRKGWEEKILTGIRYLACVCYPHVTRAEDAVVASFVTHLGKDGITTTPLRIGAGNSNTCKNKSSSFSFWESIIALAGNNAHNLLLARIAKTVFCIPASEAPCERIFSRLKHLIGDRRRRLNATTAFYLLLLTL